MAKEVKFGTWLFSINNNQKELQRALQESSSIMKTYIKKPILTLLFVAFSITTSWAQSPLAYLEQTYPQLTELYREELIKYPAHYIFAVDVSGTMNQYSGFVLQALRPFFQALQTVHCSSLYLFAKIQKKRRKCKFFVRFFFLLFSLQERLCSAGCRSRGSLSIDNKDIATWVQAALPRSH